jgi:hypothetical protein
MRVAAAALTGHVRYRLKTATSGRLTQWGLRRNLTACASRARSPSSPSATSRRSGATRDTALGHRRPRPPARAARARIAAARARRRPRPTADDDPRRRRVARPHDPLRDRRHRPLSDRGQARRLLGPDPADQAVRPELARRAHLQGRPDTLRWATLEASQQASSGGPRWGQLLSPWRQRRPTAPGWRRESRIGRRQDIRTARRR